MYKLGIIGNGRFGKLLHTICKDDFEVIVCDHGEQLDKIYTCDIIIPCVPISQFEAVIQAIAPHLTSQLVVDVCSVKEYPLKVMKENLSESVHIIGTHPMFGPDSVTDSLKGRRIAVVRERCDEESYEKFKTFLSQKKLEVIEITAQEHDTRVAQSQVLVHFLGRSLDDMNITTTNIDTHGFNQLLTIKDVTCNDTWELFEDMNNYNRFARNARKELIESLQKIDKKVQK